MWWLLLFSPSYWLKNWDLERLHNLSKVIARTHGRAEIQSQIGQTPEPTTLTIVWCGFILLQGKNVLEKWWTFLGSIEEQKFPC